VTRANSKNLSTLVEFLKVKKFPRNRKKYAPVWLHINFLLLRLHTDINYRPPFLQLE